MTFNTLVALACVAWLLSCAPSLLALYWNFKAGMRRFRLAAVLSCVGLLIGYLGISRIQLSASKTVNGHVEWSLNSRWFFVAALVLGVTALAWSLWNWRKANSSCSTPPLVEQADSGTGQEPTAPAHEGSARPLSDSNAPG